jgi:hypothetical protein
MVQKIVLKSTTKLMLFFRYTPPARLESLRRESRLARIIRAFQAEDRGIGKERGNRIAVAPAKRPRPTATSWGRLLARRGVDPPAPL